MNCSVIMMRRRDAALNGTAALFVLCAACAPDSSKAPYRIEVEAVVTLGSPDDSLLLDWPVTLAANASVIAAGRLPTSGAIALYDWRGRQIGGLTRYGGGPGEFKYPKPVLGQGDTLWIVDTGNQRVAVLEPGGRAIAREFPLRGQIGDVMRADSGLMVVAGTMLRDGATEGNGETASLPYLHVIDREGDVLRSFLPRQDSAFPRGSALPPIVAVAGDRIWLAAMHRPVLEEWTWTGERIRVLERELDWFPPWDSADMLHGIRYRPRVAELGIDVERRVWVKTYVTVADRDAVRSLPDYDRVMDTIIEALDPETGELLAQIRLDAVYVRRVVGRDLWATARQDSSGYVYVDIWRARLRRDDDE